MEDWYLSAVNDFETYVNSFDGLTSEQQKNFIIKKDHTLRVAANIRFLATSIDLPVDDLPSVVLAAVFHDIGRFRQIVEFSTLDDSVSTDHAALAIEVLKEKNYLKILSSDDQEIVFKMILYHNKFELPSNMGKDELLCARLLRDADKLDILKVLSSYYLNKNQPANHMLTWDLPSSTIVSPGVVKQIMAGKLVSKNEVKNETDVKVMQLSWVYDINFKETMAIVLRNRYFENIYNSLQKNDQIFDIYRKIKVYAENKLMK